MAQLKQWPTAKGLDDLFVAHYAQLVGRAQQLVGGDRLAAEDLVQDTFIRVALRDPDLRTLGNIESYLFVTMRNVHLSGVRRRGSRPLDGASLIDYESLEASLASGGLNQQRLAACEELTLIARYSCLRKATSKAASALILRFFHGYYHAEIAQILCTTDQAVDARLRIARAEARAFVANPNRLRAFGERQRPSRPVEWPRDEARFITSLRQSIFEARTDACLTPHDLEHIYVDASTERLATRTLAHIVSCAKCLDVLNRRFGFPLLKDRNPSDMLGRGDRKGGRPGNGSTSAGAATGSSLRSRLSDTLDDRPKELRVAVNGLFVGSQLVAGGISEQRVRILVAERIGFIEVFSEHDTCLLYLDILSPPDGPAEQSVDVNLTEGRRLSLKLTFHDAAPLVQVVYSDPTEELAPSIALRHWPLALDAANHPATQSTRQPFWKSWIGFVSFRNISTVGASILLCGAALWFWTTRESSAVSASTVLEAARVAEVRELQEGNASHRVLIVEERLLPALKLVNQKRIDVWRDGVKGINARRVYDERSQLIAGVWTGHDGTRMVYHVGERPRHEPVPPKTAPIAADDIWTREPSAGDFAGLVGVANQASLDIGQVNFVLSYRPRPELGNGLVEATLTISKSDHHATQETVVIREDGEIHQFTFMETQLESMPIESMPPTVFDPEAVLLSNPDPVRQPTSAELPVSPTVIVPGTALSFLHLGQLELDATYRLFRLRIWLGQRADVSRTAYGINVTAVVRDEEGSSSLHRSFEELIRGAAVSLEVNVAPPDIRPGDVGPDPLSLRDSPSYPLLQKFSTSQVNDIHRDERISAFVGRVVEAVARRRERVEALQTLMERWPEERLRDLDLEPVVLWQVMVQEHADAIRRETELLRVQLAPAFNAALGLPVENRADPEPLSSAADAAASAALMKTLSTYQDEVLRGALFRCPTSSCAAPDVDRLVQSFIALESVASRFARFYLRIGRDLSEPSPAAIASSALKRGAGIRHAKAPE